MIIKKSIIFLSLFSLSFLTACHIVDDAHDTKKEAKEENSGKKMPEDKNVSEVTAEKEETPSKYTSTFHCRCISGSADTFYLMDGDKITVITGNDMNAVKDVCNSKHGEDASPIECQVVSE